MLGMQRALSLIYPAQCQMCPSLVAEDGGLCPECWRDAPFLTGLVCDTCGVSLMGNDVGPVKCDDCLEAPRNWEAGRAALAYRDMGRRIVLALKHGDRIDLAEPAAGWMLRAGQDFLTPGVLLVPVPVHWSRLVSRRYNQAVELARALARQSGLEVCPDALVRKRRTRTQDGMSVAARQMNMEGAIAANPRHTNLLKGRSVCLIDDVMTSGATMTAAAKAARDAGTDHVFVLLLARVEKTP